MPPQLLTFYIVPVDNQPRIVYHFIDIKRFGGLLQHENDNTRSRSLRSLRRSYLHTGSSLRASGRRSTDFPGNLCGSPLRDPPRREARRTQPAYLRFAGWTGGIGITLGVTGGYIIGYIPMAFVAGLLYHKFGRNESGARKYIVLFISMALATAVLYILGTAWFMAQTKMTLAASLAACVIPFLPGDLIKIVAVMLVAPPIEAALKRAVPASQGAA